MKSAWRVIFIIVAIALGLALVCGIVGMITGASLPRIYGEFESFFEESYNINLDGFIHSWLPEVTAALLGML